MSRSSDRSPNTTPVVDCRLDQDDRSQTFDTEARDDLRANIASAGPELALDTDGGRRRSLVFATCFGLGLRVVLTLFADVDSCHQAWSIPLAGADSPLSPSSKTRNMASVVGSAMAALGRYPLHADRGGRLLNASSCCVFFPCFLSLNALLVRWPVAVSR